MESQRIYCGGLVDCAAKGAFTLQIIDLIEGGFGWEANAGMRYSTVDSDQHVGYSLRTHSGLKGGVAGKAFGACEEGREP